MAAPASDAPRVRVAAILEIDGEIVLVRHSKDGRSYYLLPGGGVEPGERLTDTLVREVREETGLECKPASLALVSDSIAPDGSRHMIQIAFTARATGGSLEQPSLDRRVTATETFPAERISALDFRPPIASEILAVLQGEPGSGTYVRAEWASEPERGEA